jgi:hypothetical protein
VGLNGGHSAYIALTSNPALEFHSIDICEHSYVLAVAEHLLREFPGRFFFHRGNCLQVLPRLAKNAQKFDSFHIDGAKNTYFKDISECALMVRGKSAVIIMDDADQVSLSWVWRICRFLGLIEDRTDFPAMSRIIEHRNQIGTLRALAGWRHPALRIIVAAVTLAHRVQTKVQAYMQNWEWVH